MQKTIVPEPETVLSDLSGLLGILRSALEYGAGRARDYLGISPDPWLAAHITRFHAKTYLQSAGIATAELAFSGLFVSDGRYPVRILKADHEDLPTPGPSEPKQDFYAQES